MQTSTTSTAANLIDNPEGQNVELTGKQHCTADLLFYYITGLDLAGCVNLKL